MTCEEPKPLSRFDEHNLCTGVPGKRFNPSLIEWGGGYLMAFRNGWAGSDIYLVRLNRDLQPVGDATKLHLRHEACSYGREDPRLFMHNGKLHVSFIGVVGRTRHKPLHTNQIYARIGDSLRVEAVFAPHYQARNDWEKNWQFFSHDSQLYAVYSVAPHMILRLDGNHAELVHETPTPAPWSLGTEIRGGAAPVLVGDEYWCFFHSRYENAAGRRIYVAGLYTFEAAPPFRVLRIIPDPILTARLDDKPADQYAHVVWPGGAVLRDGRWVLACGIHDRWTEIYSLDHAALQKQLVRIRPPSWWSHREHWADPGIWHHVVELDEYQLEDVTFSPGDVAIDVGAHVGCLAFRARERGCSTVHCYEPWNQSAELLEKNAAKLGGVTVFREAVGERSGNCRFTGLAHDENTGSGNVTLDPSGDVPVVPLDEMIRRAAAESPTGRVALLKLDCEGGEWPALRGATLLGMVDRMAGEWHPPGRGVDILKLLEPFGFSIKLVPTEDGRGLFWANRAP